MITEAILLALIVLASSIVTMWFQERTAKLRHRWDLEDRRARHEMTIAEIRDASAVAKSDLEETKRANEKIDVLIQNGNDNAKARREELN